MLAGLGLIGFFSTTHVWCALIGVFLVITGFLRWCPFYFPFKLHSK